MDIPMVPDRRALIQYQNQPLLADRNGISRFSSQYTIATTISSASLTHELIALSEVQREDDSYTHPDLSMDRK